MSLWVVLKGIWIGSETVNIAHVAGSKMCLLVWRVVNKTLTQVSSHVSNIVMLTINSRSPWEVISGFILKRRVNSKLLITLETWDETWASYYTNFPLVGQTVYSPQRQRGEGKHTARARKVMPILEATENEILRNFYKKEELEENSIFCFKPIQWHLTRI